MHSTHWAPEDEKLVRLFLCLRAMTFRLETLETQSYQIAIKRRFSGNKLDRSFLIIDIMWVTYFSCHVMIATLIARFTLISRIFLYREIREINLWRKFPQCNKVCTKIGIKKTKSVIHQKTDFLSSQCSVTLLAVLPSKLHTRCTGLITRIKSQYDPNIEFCPQNGFRS